MTSTVAWGVLGFARIAKMSAIPAILRTPNAHFYGVASRDESKLVECRTQFGCERAYSRYEDLLADPAIQAVYVPLPNSLHKEWAIAALRAGKHVLCEKPLAMSADEAREMVKVAQESGRLLMEAFMYRYTDRMRRVRDVLDSGVLGALRNIDCSFRFLLDRPNTIKAQPELGGGALYDVGCYPINFLGLVTGRKPVTCSAVAEMENGVDVNMSALLQYDDGLIANIHCGFNAHYRMHAEIVGTTGVLEIADTFLDFRGDIKVHTKDGTHLIPVIESDRYGAEFRDFSAAILENRQPLCGLDETIQNMEVLDMVRSALKP